VSIRGNNESSVFYIGTPSPIPEVELELIKKHEKSGDIVHVVRCTGNLPNCHWNLAHTSEKPNTPLKLTLGYHQ